MTDESVTLAAPAKLNLFLRILARESDGWHGLETLFCRISLADELRIERRSSGISIEVTGADTGPSEENLAVRAARMVLEATGNRFGVHIRLAKQIPTRAGLGGGSSDAAAALIGVNQLAVLRHQGRGILKTNFGLQTVALRNGFNGVQHESDKAVALAPYTRHHRRTVNGDALHLHPERLRMAHLMRGLGGGNQ